MQIELLSSQLIEIKCKITKCESNFALTLFQLSLRDNPLVVRFVRELMYNPPSLMELAGRTIKIKKVSYTPADLPADLSEYLNCAHQCVNPKCKG